MRMGQRLVEDDESRIVNERASERHLLPHALGETLATLVRVGAEREPADQLLGARLDAGNHLQLGALQIAVVGQAAANIPYVIEIQHQLGLGLPPQHIDGAELPVQFLAPLQQIESLPC